MKSKCLCIYIILMVLGCKQDKVIRAVTVTEFSEFVSSTNYKTDAEKYGWSIVQKDIFNFDLANGANWRVPNGLDSSTNNLPVTQVSYNDALAYCEWANVSLPAYSDYWKYTRLDNRVIIKEDSEIYAVIEVNTIGNVWDITTTHNSIEHIRLAGGSYLCSPLSCDGTNPDRELYIDKITGNTHIGFSVIMNQD